MAEAMQLPKSIPDDSSSSSTTGDQIDQTNPCVDLFFDVLKLYLFKARCRLKKQKAIQAELKASCNLLMQLLPVAWSHNPLTTLKLISNLSNRKKCPEALCKAACWLRHNHPKTLLHNVELITKWCKDGHYILVDILYVLLTGQDVLDTTKSMTLEYKLLQNRIVDVFVESLKSDLEILKKQKEHNASGTDDESYEKLTEAANCCLPKRADYFGRIQTTLLVESIARKVFLRESYPEYQGLEEADYMNRVEDRLRKEYLAPLGEVIPKARVYYYYYESHWDAVDSDKYMEEVKEGKSKIVADALPPNEIIRFVNNWDFGQVAELQWKAMVEDMKKKGAA